LFDDPKVKELRSFRHSPSRENYKKGEPKMAEVEKTGRLAGSGLDHYRHVCVLYHSMDEEFRVLQPFIKDGFQKGDKAFHIIDERQRTDHLRRLHDDLGIDVAATEQTGQLEVRGWRPTCGPAGSISTRSRPTSYHGNCGSARIVLRQAVPPPPSLEAEPSEGDIACARRTPILPTAESCGVICGTSTHSRACLRAW
jgi:MEDS: MEthanogen/methylotroph, DcmR Sensory domain